MSTQNALQAATVFAVCTLLSACANLDGTKRLRDPATVDSLDPKLGIISQAMTSDRRLVVYRGDMICLEPPPDTASNISASNSAALDATLKAASTATAPDIKASYANQLATALSHITNPSQGTLFMRYAISAACIAYMNGAIDKDKYYGLISTAFSASVAMTMFELDKSGGKIGNNVEGVTQTAPVLSGTLASIAQKAASDSATNNAGGAGKPAADAAGKQAGDAAKQKSGTDTTVDGVAATSGQAAHDAVLDTTKDPVKAEKARVDAIGNVFASAAHAAPVLAAKAPLVSSSAAFTVVLDKATQPLLGLGAAYNKDGGGGVAANAAQRVGFQALLNRDMPAALQAFDAAYSTYPTYGSVDEIRKLLHARYASLTNADDARWRELYSIIVQQYSWLGPSDLLKQMAREASGN